MRDIVRRIEKLVQRINAIPADGRRYVIELAYHNEWGLALDTLCFQIDEHDISITNEDYKEIVSLGNIMNMEESIWTELKRLIKR